MGRKMKSRPLSFFKVMINDFDRQLQLPPAFVKKYREILPGNAKLRINSGKIWNVELIEQIDEEGNNCCFFTGGGWAEFTQDVGLKMLEFVVFRFNVGKSVFDVSVYGINSSCERERQISGNQAVSDDDEKKPYQTLEEVIINPHYELLLTKNHASRVTLHNQFVREAGLKREKSMVLKYPPNKHCWPVVLSRRYPYRVDITRGWTEFRKENELEFGQTYMFEYIRCKNVIHLKLIN